MPSEGLSRFAHVLHVWQIGDVKLNSFQERIVLFDEGVGRPKQASLFARGHKTNFCADKAVLTL